MTEAIHDFFHNIFGGNVILATIIIALLPLIELRGAIPFGMSVRLWGDAALTNWQSFLYSFLGSSAIVPVLALLFIPLINALKKTKVFKKIAVAIENRIKNKSAQIENDANVQSEEGKKQSKYNKKFWLKLLGVFLFVALPLPLTGVYTGTCVAVLLGLGFWWTCGVVILGNAVAGIIMTLLSSVFSGYTHIVLYVFLGLVVLFGLYEIIASAVKKKKSKQNDTKAE
ncbi:MAG: small multi-drug export protein [Clostridia bacterium]|nr:small multi-drug export protein [Clostridia bacterium]